MMVKHKLHAWSSILLFELVLLASPLSAAIVQTGNVEPNINLWSSGTTGYIGRTSDGSVLVDASSVLASRISYLGFSPGTTGTATVTGAGSRWTNSSALFVGNDGSGMLTVTDGGEVVAAELYASPSNLLGNSTISATKGAVLDANLLFDATHGNQQNFTFGSGGTLDVNWSGGALGAGYKENGSLTVAQGVNISSGQGYLGFHSGSTGTATVTGAGSQWVNSSSLRVGFSGIGSLNIEAGGLVSNSTAGYLGYNAGSTGTATVTGAGSRWNSTSLLYVGESGNGSLTIEAGGQVSNSTGYLGYESGSTGTATVTGAGSKWTNSGPLNIRHGTLTIEAGGQVSSSDGSLGSRSGSPATATVTGVGSKWTNGRLFVGFGGNGSLTIDSGGQVISTEGHLGSSSNSPGTVRVSGTDSKWTNSFLYVGEFSNASLNIEAGGQVNNSIGYIGYEPGTTGTATVTGAGSRWTNSSSLYVGQDGNGILTVADGGEVVALELYASLSDLLGDGTITATQGAVLDADLLFDATHGNQAILSFGSGGTLTVNAGGRLGAGYKQSGSLTVAEGVAISSNTGYLGFRAGSTGTATVTGAGSLWTNSSTLYVGESGNGSLTIEAGGQVTNPTSYLGHKSGSTGTATVTGAGSKWTSSNALYVGDDGSGMLTVTDGGAVVAGLLYASLSDLLGNGTITATNGAVLDADLMFDAMHGTQATVSFGSGGTLTVNAAGGTLGAGYKQTGSLTVAEGVNISSNNGYLGYESGSTGTATVTGAGSKWTNSSSLSVGYVGSGALLIEAGGHVSNFSGNLGSNSGSTGTAIVTGPGSQWTNNFSLYVGNRGSGTLSIEAGGQVSNNDYAYVGYESNSTGTVTVTGAGSRWTNNSRLYLGFSGNGSMTIAAGGQVSNTESRLGNGNSLSSISKVTVTGAGSQWINSGPLNIRHGTLTIEAGGQVSNTVGSLGGTIYESTGTAVVTGSGSRWANSSSLIVGQSYGVAALTITSGGLVTVGGTLTIRLSDNYVYMATGGKLALRGDADDSLSQFLSLVTNPGRMRYWDNSLGNWSPLTAATYGDDYTLSYLTTGELNGYTLLTVGTVGDFDGDGDVDGRDFLAWQRNPELGSLADWQTNYGAGSLVAESVAVPEPSALLLLGLGLVRIVPRRTNRGTQCKA